MDLNSTRITIAAQTESDRQAAAWALYESIFLNQPDKPIGIHQCHDGSSVIFHADCFKRAFFKPGDQLNHPRIKDTLDLTRVERINWILPIIQGQVAGTTCWQVTMPGFPHAKRLYVAHRPGFMVWLEPRIDRSRGDWRFATAYLASPRHVQSKIAMGKLIFDSDIESARIS